MPLTAHQLTFPVLGDANNPPAYIQALAESVDARYGLTVANTAALAAISSPYAGMRVWVTSILALATYNGTAWTWPNGNLVSLTTSSSATSGTTELTLATSASLTYDGVTSHEFSFNGYSLTQTVATDAFVIRLYVDTTMIGQARVGSALSSPGFLARAAVTPTAGAHTGTARVIRATGTGTATLVAQSDAPAQLLIRKAP